jgi:hypothetical protein
MAVLRWVDGFGISLYTAVQVIVPRLLHVM